jgi:subtilase family serine protease
VANKGTTSAKAVEAKLIINGNLVDVDYVSELKENRETTFDFPLVLKGTGQLVLSYVGPGIEKNNVTKDVVFNYTQPSGSDGTGFIIIIVIVAVVVLYLWRRGKKKKK